MTTTNRPTPLGELAAAPSARAPLGAPLPLVTQPLRGLERGERGDVTRIEAPSAVQRAADAVLGRATVAMSPLAAPARPGRAPLVADGPAPEIGLTQHALPDGPPGEVLDRRLVLARDPDGERAAAFRVLRHHLLEVGRPQCVVVAGARPGDGATTTAANLALALAECGRARVLLVDCHLRRPQLAKLFDLVPPWCFAEQLAAHRHQAHMPWSFVDIPALWLHVAAIRAPAPAAPGARAQLLDGPAFAIAMDRLRAAGYDHVVIDAPPVLGSADVNLMADAADTVLLAVRARRTTSRDLRAAIEQLGEARVAGTVLLDG